MLAIVTGCVASIPGALSLGLFPAIGASVLIFGAILQPRYRRVGAILLALGTLFLTVTVLPIGVVMIVAIIRTWHFFSGFNEAAITLLWLISFILVVWFDVTIVLEAVKTRIAKSQ
jgi:hypothetical protein